jgi:tetratricopeptide (TPR) repeat protein
MAYSHLVFGELDSAADEFQTGLTVPTAFLHLGKPELLVGLADVAIERGRWTEAADLLREARTYAESVGLLLVLPLITLAESRLESEQGDHRLALERYERAEEAALRMGLRPIVLQARCGAAAALDALGESGQAETKRQAAQSTIDAIAGLFQDAVMRDQYRRASSRLLRSPGPATW